MQAVGTRACYLFSRLVRSLRQNMRPLLSDILLRLQPHLAHILADPLPEAEPAAKGAEPIPGSHDTLQPVALSLQCRDHARADGCNSMGADCACQKRIMLCSCCG